MTPQNRERRRQHHMDDDSAKSPETKEPPAISRKTLIRCLAGLFSPKV